jgi:hypothetical protein
MLYKYKLPQGDLAPKGMFGLAWRNNVPGMPFVGGSKRFFERKTIVASPMTSDVLGVQSLPRPVGLEDVACHARRT